MEHDCSRLQAFFSFALYEIQTIIVACIEAEQYALENRQIFFNTLYLQEARRVCAQYRCCC